MAKRESRKDWMAARRYSGDASRLFWKRIHSLNGPAQLRLYSLGCELQELEAKVLGELHIAELDKAASKGAKR